jgi:DNA-binding winged helix-turn-helix (wHTH) protein
LYWQFLEFELDPIRYELRRTGVPVPVANLVFDLMVHLVRARRRLVTKGEVFGALWGGRVVTGASLTQAVTSARRILADDPKQPRIIQTVRGRGYRWIAETREVSSPMPEPRALVTGSRFDLAEELIAAALFV